MLFDWLFHRLSPSARALLTEERAAVEDDELKRRALARAEATLEGERWSGVALRRAEQRALVARAGRRRGVALAAAAVAFGGLAVAGLGWPTPSPSERRAPPASVVSRPVTESRLPSALPPRPAVEAERASPPPAPSAGATRPRPSRASQYAMELALLEPARGSMARGSYGAALVAIAKHQREYPSGQLAQEREAMRVRALWGLGQKAEAHAAASAFRKRYPRSVLLSWMKDATP